MRFSHGRKFFDLRNAQKSVTQIIYLGPLPRGHTGAERSVGFQGPETQQGSMLTKLRQCMEQPEKDTEKDPEKTLEDRNLHGEGDCSFVWMIRA